MDPRALGLLRVVLACAVGIELWRGAELPFDHVVVRALGWLATVAFALGLRTSAAHVLLWAGLALPALWDNQQLPHRFLSLPHLLSWTLLLPLGARMSIDALRRSLGAREEYVAADLADRAAMRAPVPRQAACVELFGWVNLLFGVALHLSGVREVLLAHWHLGALALLALRTRHLDAIGARLEPVLSSTRRLECFFDAGCGICFQLARLLARLDRYGHLELLSNRDTERLPRGVTEALIEETIVVRDVERDRIYTRAQAMAVLCRALPLGFVAWAALSVPGLGGVWRALYDVVARNRVRISAALGLAACKLPPRTQDGAAAPH